jgi:hypothetical protein
LPPKRNEKLPSLKRIVWESAAIVDTKTAAAAKPIDEKRISKILGYPVGARTNQRNCGCLITILRLIRERPAISDFCN